MTNDIDEALARIQNKVPSARIQKAEEYPNAYIVRRPTGILTLDMGIGGGFPAGGISELWGADNVGKNLIANHVMAMNQSIHGESSRIAICCVEYDFDKGFAGMCGLNVAYTDEEIATMQQEAGGSFSTEEIAALKKQVGDVRFISAGLAEGYLETIAQLVETDLFQIIFLDSVAALLAADEAEKQLTEPGMTGTALPRLMARFNRRLRRSYFEQPHGRPNLTSVIVTNQITAKIGGMSRPGMPPPVQEKAGYALKHGKLVSLQLKKGAPITGSNKVLGHAVKWKVTKGKAGCPDGAIGEFLYRHDRGIDFEEDALTGLKQSGMLSASGGSYRLPSWDIMIRGKENFLEHMREISPLWWMDIHGEALYEAGIYYNVRWHNGAS